MAYMAHLQVDFIEQDSVARTYRYVEEQGAPWGLVRLSTDELDDQTTYTYDSSAGKGTCAYVIDTGVDDEHYVSRPLFCATRAPLVSGAGS